MAPPVLISLQYSAKLILKCSDHLSRDLQFNPLRTSCLCHRSCTPHRSERTLQRIRRRARSKSGLSFDVPRCCCPTIEYTDPHSTHRQNDQSNDSQRMILDRDRSGATDPLHSGYPPTCPRATGWANCRSSYHSVYEQHRENRYPSEEGTEGLLW